MGLSLLMSDLKLKQLPFLSSSVISEKAGRQMG